MRIKEYFSLKNAKGCRRLLCLLLGIILLSSLCAALVSSDGGKVKVSHITIDSRGATFEMNLYVPAGTSDADKLPAVIVSHGRGAHYRQTQGIAEEFARRGYVVINAAAYGTAMNEMPVSDDGQQGKAVYFIDDTPQGLLDTVNYLRTLHYVDTSRIGIVGHSSGSRKAGFTAILDSGYYTFNDVMVNVLYNQFGVQLPEADIETDADILAQANLDAGQLALYDYIKAEEAALYDSRVKSICLIGSNANKVGPVAEVSVGGYEVTRTCKVNFSIINGEWDFGYRDYYADPAAMEAWYTGDAIALDTWYALDDSTKTSRQLGRFGEQPSPELQEAISECSTRLYKISGNESHAKNVMSSQTTTAAIQYMDTVLGHTSPASATGIRFPLRAMLNGVAMLAMLALVFPIAGLYQATKGTAAVTAGTAQQVQKVNKKTYWIAAAITVVMTFVAIYIANNGNYSPFANRYLPGIFRLIVTARNSTTFIFLTGAIAFVSLAFLLIKSKLQTGKTGLASLNSKIGISGVLKYLALAFVAIAVCYTSLLAIRYLFNQDYGLWLSAFTDMKVEYWGVAFAYALLFLPCFLLTGAATNYTIRTDIPRWRDTLQVVIINSAGLWLCCLANIVVMLAADKPFSLFTGSYQMVLFLPILTYFTRKLYTMTKSIWFGAFFSSMLIAWSLVSSTGTNDLYYAQGFFSTLFGA